MEWFPIETAPKDNKKPLYLAKFDSEGELQAIDFNATWEYFEESWELAHINGYCWVSEKGTVEEPTHWAYQDKLTSKKVKLQFKAFEEANKAIHEKSKLQNDVYDRIRKEMEEK